MIWLLKSTVNTYKSVLWWTRGGPCNHPHVEGKYGCFLEIFSRALREFDQFYTIFHPFCFKSKTCLIPYMNNNCWIRNTLTHLHHLHPKCQQEIYAPGGTPFLSARSIVHSDTISVYVHWKWCLKLLHIKLYLRALFSCETIRLCV